MTQTVKQATRDGTAGGLGIDGSKGSLSAETGEKLKNIDAGRLDLVKFLWLLLISSSAHFLSASVEMKKEKQNWRFLKGKEKV